MVALLLLYIRFVILTYVLTDPTYLQGRAANIYYRRPGSPKDEKIGTLGILHPFVLEKFEIGFPCSALEFNLEPFKKEVDTVWTAESRS
jgi:phenylalanyl-tRNA synthetase beta chain